MENLQSLIQPRCCSMFILKVLELFYIKKGLCFPKMLSLLITSRRSQCISHVMLFLVTHIALNYQVVQWAIERVVDRIGGRLNRIVISGDETHLDLGGNHQRLFHALCI